MRKFIKSGYRLQIEENLREVTTLADDISITSMPSMLQLDIRIFGKEDAIKAIEDFFAVVVE
jgi:hypothetical protein